MLVDDENLGKYCGCTTAGLGKREDRQTAIERRHYYLGGDICNVSELVLAELCTSIDNSVNDFLLLH